MIEVEKKFIPEEGNRERVIESAEFIGEAINEDTYYDKKDFELTKRDSYIRKRNGVFEMKVGVRKQGLDGVISTYEEIHDEDAIRKRLGIEKKKSLEEDLEKNGYVPFGAWKTTRKKYRKDGFTIDVDSVDYGYDVIEIELLAEDEDGVKEAAERIFRFAETLGLTNSPKTGKVSAYLKKRYPEEYREIRKAWDHLGPADATN